MKSKPERARHERQDWAIVLILLLLGFLCVILAGQWALRLSPSWKLDTDMGSNLDPDSDFLTNKPVDFIVPLDPDILTKPAWEGLFTPGVDFVTRTPLPTRPLSTATVPTTELPTLPAGTSTLLPTSTAVPTNTFIWLPLPPATNTRKPRPADTATNTPVPGATLLVTNTDNATEYVPGTSRTYTITVSNTVLGSSNVVGAAVTDVFPPEMLSHDWTCAGILGGTCAAGGSGDINDLINLPFNSSVTYTVNVTTDAGVPVNLSNMVSVSLPAGYTGPTPVTVSDTDQLLTSNPFPVGNIDETKNTTITTIPTGSSVTLTFSTPLIVGAGNYLVYYEMAAGSGILMDQVIIEVSDGNNWYTIFNWGSGGPDTNSNLDVSDPLVGGTEDDNRDFAAGMLFNSTGVTIQVDGVIPNGSYPYVRITAPGSDTGDGCDIDAIDIMP